MRIGGGAGWRGLTGAHVAGDMLRAGEGGLADGALVVASHVLSGRAMTV